MVNNPNRTKIYIFSLFLLDLEETRVIFAPPRCCLIHQNTIDYMFVSGKHTCVINLVNIGFVLESIRIVIVSDLTTPTTYEL